MKYNIHISRPCIFKVSEPLSKRPQTLHATFLWRDISLRLSDYRYFDKFHHFEDNQKIPILFIFLGILNRTKSQQGHRLLKTWFLRPSTNLDVILERQKTIKFFSQPKNIEALTTLQDCLKNMKNIMVRICQTSMEIWFRYFHSFILFTTNKY